MACLKHNGSEYVKVIIQYGLTTSSTFSFRSNGKVLVKRDTGKWKIAQKMPTWRKIRDAYSTEYFQEWKKDLEYKEDGQKTPVNVSVTILPEWRKEYFR